jgi:hypothetical protein
MTKPVDARTAIFVLLAVVATGVMAYQAFGPRVRSSTPPRAAADRTPPGRTHAAVPAAAPDPSAYQVELRPPAADHGSDDNHVFTAKGVLEPGTREIKSFVLPRMDRMTVVLMGDGTRYAFRSPSGETIVPGETRGRAGYRDLGGEGGFSGFALERPERGTWTAVIEAMPAGGAAAYAIDIRSEGSAEEVAHLETMLRDSDPSVPFLARPGDPVFVRVFITDRGKPVRSVHWDVRALTPNEGLVVIPVYDDGRHADERADDGVSVGAIVAEGPDGYYQLRAAGRSPTGVEYAVTGTIEVQAQNDLLIADTIAVSPASPGVGERVTLTVTVVNAGTVDSRAVELEFYLGAVKVSGQTFDLKAGVSKQVATTWTPTAAGNYDVQLTINPFVEPYACDFTNNTRKTVVQVR